MADETEETENEEKPKKKGGILIAIILALVLGGGGGAAGYMGFIPLPFFQGEAEETMPDITNTIFIPLPKIVVTLGEDAQAKHLRAQFAIETDPNYEERVNTLQPRLMDVFNTYLRVVEEKELTNQSVSKIYKHKCYAVPGLSQARMQLKIYLYKNLYCNK